MAESKNAANKMKKEVVILQKKLTVVEKKLKNLDKAWKNKYQAQQSAQQKDQALAYQRGYAEGLADSVKKDTARKQALHVAELAFEKEYRTKAQQLKKTKKKLKADQASKVTKSPKHSGKKVSQRSIGKRGRPSKTKKETPLSEEHAAPPKNE